jgi:hypothetical protein
MRGLRRRICERDGSAESIVRLPVASECVQQRAAQAVKMEIAGEAALQRLDHGERGLRATHLGDGDRAVERDDG